MKYPYLIIDDDKENAMKTQSAFDSFSNYFLLGTTDKYDDAVNLVLEHNPKLIVLEIDPDNKDSRLSLSLINELHRFVKTMPKVIILTKGKELAYDALKNEVFDYLIKPINIHELRKTIMKFERNVEDTPTTLCIKSYGDYRFVDTEDIVYLQADNNSTDLFINNGDTITAFKTLKHFENTLPPEFVRIHNSYIINMNYVSRIHLGNNVCYIKNSKTQLPFSKSYKKNVDLIISLISNTDTKYL